MHSISIFIHFCTLLASTWLVTGPELGNDLTRQNNLKLILPVPSIIVHVLRFACNIRHGVQKSAQVAPSWYGISK